MKKIYHTKFNHKKADLFLLTSDKLDFKMRTILRDKEGHLQIIKINKFIE